MESTRFSIKEAIKFGWEVTKNNLGILIVCSLIYVIFYIIGEIIDSTLRQNFVLWFFSLLIHYNILFGFVYLGMLKVFLKLYKGEKANFYDLFSQYYLILRYLLVGLIIFLVALGLLMTFLGTIVFILALSKLSSFVKMISIVLVVLSAIAFFVVLIILFVRLSFFDYLIVDKNYSAIESLKNSLLITKGNTLRIIIFYILQFLIALSGLLLLGIGVLITLSIAFMARTYVYKQLVSQIETQPVS